MIPRMIIIRSFDVNKPGCDVEKLCGGIAGGSILQVSFYFYYLGVLSQNDEIEIRPGVVSRNVEGHLLCKPIRTRIVSLFADSNDLQFAVPGGLIGVGTMIDPSLCRADKLVGQVLGKPGHLPDIFTEVWNIC